MLRGRNKELRGDGNKPCASLARCAGCRRTTFKYATYVNDGRNLRLTRCSVVRFSELVRRKLPYASKETTV